MNNHHFSHNHNNNTTSWVGHLPGQHNEISKGQTFTAPAHGRLKAIEVFSNAVGHPGHMSLTLHTYNPEQKQWGPAIGSSDIEIDNSNAGNWVAFNVNAPMLEEGKTYGFKLQSHDSLVGIGEVVSIAKNNEPAGEEWVFDENAQPKVFNYFALEYKLKMSA